METARDRALSAKTLVCFLQSLTGEKVVVELKDDYQIIGTIRQVDAYMNVEMVGVTIRKPIDLKSEMYEDTSADYILIKGPRVRYVSVPDESVDVINNINQRINSIKAHRKGVVQSVRKRKAPL